MVIRLASVRMIKSEVDLRIAGPGSSHTDNAPPRLRRETESASRRYPRQALDSWMGPAGRLRQRGSGACDQISE